MANGHQIGRPALYSSQLNATRFLALSPANMDILIRIGRCLHLLQHAHRAQAQVVSAAPGACDPLALAVAMRTQFFAAIFHAPLLSLRL
eukprot:6213154-Pleurochrysis_carterae.AAC.1